jgi:hypothetical protein
MRPIYMYIVHASTCSSHRDGSAISPEQAIGLKIQTDRRWMHVCRLLAPGFPSTSRKDKKKRVCKMWTAVSPLPADLQNAMPPSLTLEGCWHHHHAEPTARLNISQSWLDQFFQFPDTSALGVLVILLAAMMVIKSTRKTAPDPTDQEERFSTRAGIDPFFGY